jgi:hypothetical protein
MLLRRNCVANTNGVPSGTPFALSQLIYGDSTVIVRRLSETYGDFGRGRGPPA